MSTVGITTVIAPNDLAVSTCPNDVKIAVRFPKIAGRCRADQRAIPQYAAVTPNPVSP